MYDDRLSCTLVQHLHLHLHGYTPPSVMTSVARVVASLRIKRNDRKVRSEKKEDLIGKVEEK